MEEIPEQDPLPPLRVGLTYNLKKNVNSDIEDIEAEYDSMDTVLAIKNALEQSNCRVELMEATGELLNTLSQSKPDIVFNFAEGISGRGREAQVPAIMNLLRIPFSGSDETTLCIALDKALAKRLVASYHIKTPKYKIVFHENPKPIHNFSLPAIVKPNAEGSSKGISDVAIATGIEELNRLVSRNISIYRQNMLVEEYIEGREYTVALLGNDSDLKVFPPMEIIHRDQSKPFHIYSYSVKQNCMELIKYECPASVDSHTEAEMIHTAKRIYNILGCKDFARIDFRLGNDGKLYFIEINPLPGLAPGYSDYPMIAEACGMEYETLVRKILNSALKRFDMPEIPE
ncbi:MAG: D-alanine--D-alanine ligase [Firmicutes bacterium ADurb.Bin182]|nr:MAG: D-alanine--D-alanine ligase [Firmicutes bacterium ADurb.Bin182]